jgi:hypothetical protein
LRVPTSFVFEFLLLLFGEGDGQLFQRGHLIVDVLIDDSSHPQTPPFILPQKFFFFLARQGAKKGVQGWREKMEQPSLTWRKKLHFVFFFFSSSVGWDLEI